MPAKKCPKCGYDNDPRVRFCDLCKSKFETPTGVIKPVAAPEGVVFSVAPRKKAVVPDTERRFVVPPAGEPVALTIGVQVVIGRDEACGVKLVSGKVSRQHAELRWQGEVCFVCDLGSQNGTSVNGERLPPKGIRELKNKDEIEIGGVPIVYRVLAPGVPETELAPEGRSTEQAMGAANALAGSVDIVSLATIIERLATLGATGTLRVESGGTQGQLRLESGRAVFGTFGKEVGDNAIAAVSRLAEGRYRFDRET